MQQHLRLALLLGLIFGALLYFSSPAQAQDRTRSVRIRAAVVFYIAKFVRWPNESESSSKALEVCISEHGLFEELVIETLSGKSIRGRPLEIRKLEDPLLKFPHTVPPTCEIIILSSPSEKFLASCNTKLRDRPVLSVCNVDEVVWGGCLVQIFDKNNKASIAIDLQRAEALNFQISAELLSLATVRRAKSDSTE